MGCQAPNNKKPFVVSPEIIALPFESLVIPFELEFAQFVGANFAVATSSGTDSLIIALRSLGVGHGDEVITVANGPVPTIGGPQDGLLQTKPQLIKKIAAIPITPGIARRKRSPKKSKLGLGLLP